MVLPCSLNNQSVSLFLRQAAMSIRVITLRFPSLFSHVTKPNYSVKSVCSYPPLNLALKHRLSHAAQSELHNLQTVLATFVLDENVPDVRISRIDSRPQTTKSAYLAAFDRLQGVPFATPTWKNYSTNRCHMFL
jgi:hypothetical protein